MKNCVYKFIDKNEKIIKKIQEKMEKDKIEYLKVTGKVKYSENKRIDDLVRLKTLEDIEFKRSAEREEFFKRAEKKRESLTRKEKQELYKKLLEKKRYSKKES